MTTLICKGKQRYQYIQHMLGLRHWPLQCMPCLQAGLHGTRSQPDICKRLAQVSSGQKRGIGGCGPSGCDPETPIPTGRICAPSHTPWKGWDPI